MIFPFKGFPSTLRGRMTSTTTAEPHQTKKMFEFRWTEGPLDLIQNSINTYAALDRLAAHRLHNVSGICKTLPQELLKGIIINNHYF